MTFKAISTIASINNLEFEIDYDNGFHLISVYLLDQIGERARVNDIQKFWNHGFIYENDREKHVIAQKDFECLLAIRALNPRIDENGVIRKIYPKVKVNGHVDQVSKDLEEI